MSLMYHSKAKGSHGIWIILLKTPHTLIFIRIQFSRVPANRIKKKELKRNNKYIDIYLDARSVRCVCYINKYMWCMYVETRLPVPVPVPVPFSVRPLELSVSSPETMGVC